MAWLDRRDCAVVGAQRQSASRRRRRASLWQRGRERVRPCAHCAGARHRRRRRGPRRQAARHRESAPEYGRSRFPGLSPALSRHSAGDGDRHRPPPRSSARDARRQNARHDPAREGGRRHGARAERARADLLAAVPALLGRHFERLRQAEQASMAAARPAGTLRRPPPAPGWTFSARTCRACCSPNWMFVFNRSKGCSRPFAPANWDAISDTF